MGFFDIFKSDKAQERNTKLKIEATQLQVQVADLQLKLGAEERMGEQRMQTIQALEAKIEDQEHGLRQFKTRIAEAEEERDAMSESVDQLHNNCRALETENAQLRSSIAHLYHFIASVQDVIKAFDARAKMVPDNLDLSEAKMRSILEEFDRDLKDTNRIKEILESSSFTIEIAADDTGKLTEWLTLHLVAEAINEDLSRRNIQDLSFTFTEDNFAHPREILRQKELGLLDVHFKLPKNVKGVIKLWIVPNHKHSPAPCNN